MCVGTECVVLNSDTLVESYAIHILHEQTSLQTLQKAANFTLESICPRGKFEFCVVTTEQVNMSTCQIQVGH